jgi:polyhydroxybutyrate depolymerase
MMMIKWIVTCLVLLAMPVWADSQTVVLGDRSYTVDLPARAAGAPIILALHGGGGNPAQFARNSGLTRPANAKGYAVIYPAGSGRMAKMLTWNGGYCCAYAMKAGVDDLAFLDQVVADAAKRFGLDAQRLYVTGMSNGSLMAEVYGAARASKVRAIGAVSGSLDVDHTRITGPVPILVIHGMADNHVPFAGGVGAAGKVPTDWASVDQVIAAFVKAAPPPLTKADSVIDPVKDDTRVLATDYTDAQGQVMVRLLAIEGGGHVWPGGRRAERDGGTADIDANTEVLRFFALHP